MVCQSLSALVWTPWRSSSKRSTVLLLTMAVMMICIHQYDVTYPYDYQQALPDDTGQHLMDSDESWNKTCDMCNFYDVSGFAKDLGYKCIATRTKPSATVCLYDEWTDMYISHDLQYTGIWEPHIWRDIQEALSRNRYSGFIDLGANIGFYTLIAARMGHPVIAVEPFRESIYRIHRALYLEKLGDRVYVLENGISDKRQKATLRRSGNNQGDNRLKLDVRPCVGSCPTLINTIVLDDLVDVIQNNFSSAILKMDIQGFEHKAFEKAARLFHHVRIHYIFMEWFVMTKFYVNSSHVSNDKFLVERLLRFLFDRHFQPFSLTKDGGKPLDPHFWHIWPFDVIWIRKPNEQERQTILSNHFTVWPP